MGSYDKENENGEEYLEYTEMGDVIGKWVVRRRCSTSTQTRGRMTMELYVGYFNLNR